MFRLLICVFLLGSQLLTAQNDESECVYEPGLAYEYYDYACPCEVGYCSPRQSPCRFQNDAQYGRECGLKGIWMPEAPTLFQPFAADPREISYSIAWRFHDKALSFKNVHPRSDEHKGNNIVAVSYGDNFPIYRWFNVWPWCGELQMDLQGALWAVFAPSHESAPLINADYYVGIPITYGIGCWSFRLRGYHISCHIGDEFLLINPDFDRRNPSSEFLDFFASYLYQEQVRIYGGGGVAVTQDSSFKCGRAFAAGGVEVRPKALRGVNCKNRFYSVPFFAMHLCYRDRQDQHLNSTFALGYEWGKYAGLEKKVRVFLEYHDGYSVEGQFCMEPTKYLSIKTTYSY